MAKNNFPFAEAGIYSDAYAVTKSDSTELNPIPQALWVGGTGDLVVTMPSGDITLTAVPAGMLIPLRALKVKAATSATLIIALV